MTKKIKQFLAETYPELGDFFLLQKTIPKITPTSLPLPEAVVRVVVGQMLSGKAALTIYKRITNARDSLGLSGSWLLDHETLRQCGLSNAKANTIVNFGIKIGKKISALEHWHTLDVDHLQEEILMNKGLGVWTAGIISLFYIGHPDIFPVNDGSLQKVIEILTLKGRKLRRGYKFDPVKASPYRSYLALYMWQALDTKTLL